MKNVLRKTSAKDFNRRFPVGSRFRYYPVVSVPDSEEVVTRSVAWHLQNGKTVVRVEGKIGGVSVYRLEPLEAFHEVPQGQRG
ncbi:Uncharacterised protein [Klebsiella pneumoniae]|uniref:Uncharacterized protein n=1 Tax=Klebsiella pneumoniae TaxID=573 RepID=A0A2X3D7S8_KLEPN|nr:Uncharacterised protein [Klebsiella pneumoniae]HDU1552613.1 hypothetical protein [Klebsiella pneumoniae]